MSEQQGGEHREGPRALRRAGTSAGQGPRRASCKAHGQLGVWGLCSETVPGKQKQTRAYQGLGARGNGELLFDGYKVLFGLMKKF